MGSVTKILAQIEANALTPEEVSERSGLSISEVIEVLDFLGEFGLVKPKGPRVVVSDEMISLPES